MGKLATWIGITIGNLIYYGPQARWEDLFTASYFSGGALLVYHLVCRVSRSNPAVTVAPLAARKVNGVVGREDSNG
jgi:hypothetical protein